MMRENPSDKPQLNTLNTHLQIYSPKHFHPHSLKVKLKLLPMCITVHVIVFQPALTQAEFITVRQLSCGKVIFSQEPACHSVQGWVPMLPLPIMHCTSPYRDPPTLDQYPLVTSSGQDRRLVHIRITPPHTHTHADTWWLATKHVRCASRRYASYWNASLLNI